MKRLADRSLNVDVKFDETSQRWVVKKELNVTADFDNEAEAVNWSKEPLDSDSPTPTAGPNSPMLPGPVEAPVNAAPSKEQPIEDDLDLGLDLDLDSEEPEEDLELEKEVEARIKSKLSPRSAKRLDQDKTELFKDFSTITAAGKLTQLGSSRVYAQLMNHTRQKLNCTYHDAEQLVSEFQQGE